MVVVVCVFFFLPFHSISEYIFSLLCILSLHSRSFSLNEAFLWYFKSHTRHSQNWMNRRTSAASKQPTQSSWCMLSIYIFIMKSFDIAANERIYKTIAITMTTTYFILQYFIFGHFAFQKVLFHFISSCCEPKRSSAAFVYNKCVL